MTDIPYDHTPQASHFEYTTLKKNGESALKTPWSFTTGSKNKNSGFVRTEDIYSPIESPAQTKHNALHYMSQCTGWCSLEKGAILVDLILKHKPDVIVEIGVWAGRSLIPMAWALKATGKGVAYGIDPWDSHESLQWLTEEANQEFWETADHDWILKDLLDRISLLGLQDQIQLIQSTSENAPSIPDIDLLHIDGNHSDYTSYLDATKWVPLVKSGGFIVFDDIHWFEKGINTTSRAVEWLDNTCIRVAEFSEQNDWAIWVKP